MNWSEFNEREITVKAAAGFVGGIAAWVPLEIWYTLNPSGLFTTTSLTYSYYLIAMLLPAFVGTLINATDLKSFTLNSRSKQLLLLTFFICFALGLPATLATVPG
jgi:hypothetical protein